MNTSANPAAQGVFIQLKRSRLGVLIQGASGIGKSRLALQLIDRGHRLIADDLPEFQQKGPQLIGSCPPLLQNQLAVRGLGVLDVVELFGSRAVQAKSALHLIVELHQEPLPSDVAEADVFLSFQQRHIGDCAIPLVFLNVMADPQPALSLEILCQQWHLCQQGKDSQSRFIAAVNRQLVQEAS